MTGSIPGADGPSAPQAVVVDIDLSGTGNPATVLSAISQIFGPGDGIEVVLVVEDAALDEEVALRVQGWCLDSEPRGVFPDAVLLPASEADPLPAVLRVIAGRDPDEDARAVVALATAAQPALVGGEVRARVDRALAHLPAPGDAPPGLVGRLAARMTRARAELAQVAKDAHRETAPVRVCVFLQYVVTWGSMQTVCEALRDDPRVELSFVAIEGFFHGPGASARTLRDAGYEVHDPRWFVSVAAHLDIVLLDGPYDGFRPPPLRSQAMAESGLRLAYIPYGSNVGGGQTLDVWANDLPLHQLAWRIYLRSTRQREAFAVRCSVGAGHVRVLGVPKVDRVFRARTGPVGRAWREQAGGRTVVLWNPHYTVVDAHGLAWSTFHLYVHDLLRFFADRDDAVLLIRPHYRLWVDLAGAGGELAGLEALVRRAAEGSGSILLDEHPDYEETFAVANVLVSDASSLVPEFMPSGRPVVYTPRPGGPGLTEDAAAYFGALYRAESWSELEQVLTALVAGEDPLRDERLRVLAAEFEHADGRAGARIAADVVEGFLAETRP